jgi:hypothetical protein
MDEAQHSDTGVAGRSARRAAERRRQQLEQARSSRSSVANALFGPTEQQKRLAAEAKHWGTGACGEEMLAEALAAKCPAVALLHDRRIPKSRANIDHIAVTSSGVYVIDAKRYRGKIEVRSPWFGKPTLVIAGRDQTKLVTGLERQVDVVTSLLKAVAPAVPVLGCFCFVAPEGLFTDVGLPVRRTLRINDLSLYYTRRIAKQLNASGAVTLEEIETIRKLLAQQLPTA